MSETTEIPVKYIFRRPRWKDNLYGSGLEFVTGQTRLVPTPLALKLLRHTDTFEVDAEFTGKTPPKTSEQEVEDAMLQQEKLAELERQRMAAIFDEFDQIDRMVEPTDLARYATEKYSVTLDQTKPVDALRAEVKALVDRFGVQ